MSAVSDMLNCSPLIQNYLLNEEWVFCFLLQCQETCPSSCLVAVFEICCFCLGHKLTASQKNTSCIHFSFPVSPLCWSNTQTYLSMQVQSVCGVPVTIFSSGCVTTIPVLFVLFLITSLQKTILECCCQQQLFAENIR